MQHAAKVYSVVVGRLGLVQFEPDPSSIEKKVVYTFCTKPLAVDGIPQEIKCCFFKKKRSTWLSHCSNSSTVTCAEKRMSMICICSEL